MRVSVSFTHLLLAVLLRGYVQTPGWSYVTLHPTDMNSIVRVEVPRNHSVMITMLYLNLTGRRYMCDTSEVKLVLYKNRIAESNIVWHCLVEEPVQREHLSLGSNLYVHFQSGKTRKVGFRMFFSVHTKSTLLREEHNGAWNCTVPNFRDFKPHFPCDLHPQCANKEDERDCPYFSEDCGLGFVTLGDHCLFYEKKLVLKTWRQMECLCNRRGGTLVNIRRREDHDKLVGYLRPLADVWGFCVLRYRNEFQHSDKTIAFFRMTSTSAKMKALCGSINVNKDYSAYILLNLCAIHRLSSVLCETRKRTPTTRTSPAKIQIRFAPSANNSLLLLLHCPLGHVTRDFLACDFDSTCWPSHEKQCPAPLVPLPPSFTCVNNVERVPYTLVCDIRPDCSDNSDESFCVFPPCNLLDPFHCSNQQCVARCMVCDGQKNCHNAADEDLCSNWGNKIYISPTPPAIVQLSQHGQFIIHTLSQSHLADFSPAECPETHFRCPENGYCMPVFLRCNGVYDCLGREDEADCYSYTCPGFYHCRGSKVCLHPDQLCDRIFQCPQNDDELLCDLSCPENCICYGLAFYCRRPFRIKNITTLRFLDARNSGTEVSDIKNNTLLIYLNIADNNLTHVINFNFPNLRYLDLNDNKLRNIDFQDLRHLQQLQSLSLSGNPLLCLFQCMGLPGQPTQLLRYKHINATSLDISLKYNVLKAIRALDLSKVKIKVLNSSFLSSMPNLHSINISGGGVDTLLGEGFQALTELRTLDLRGCPLTHFPRNVLIDLNKLETVYSENMKICCPATLPTDFPLKNCHAPHNEMSSCEALLKFNVYRISLSIFAFLALFGNASSFCYRVCLQKKKQLLSFDVFVAHLCGSDFLMGVFLSMIGVADRLYQGTYLWEDVTWMNSAACHMAGFLCLVSSEVSALVICLITVDRFLVLRFPFSTFHFGTRTAQVASLCAWLVGCLLATVPLTPWGASWKFYGRTGICIPLPVSRSGSPGYAYVLGIMIVANLVFLIVTATGQVFIYYSIRVNSVSSVDNTRRLHVTIARRLITVAMSDFLCWFPIGLVGLLAATGTSITGEVNVAMAIFVLPFNSALNPFLYTLNIVLENRRRADEERLKQRLIVHFRSNDRTFTTDQAAAPNN